MTTDPLLSNVPFFECLPVGLTVFNRDWRIRYINTWMRDRLHESPTELNDLMSWGNADWREFLRSLPTMTGALCAPNDYWMNIATKEGQTAGERRGIQVSVSVHHLNAPLEDAIVMVMSDISALRETEERLRGTLAAVTELSDTAISQASALKAMNSELEERVRKRTADLRSANMDSLHMLAVACEAKDHDTGEHVLRVQRYTELLARELGCTTHEAHEYGYSSILHDVGKVHIPDAILHKPGALSDEERKIINEHPLAGERILGRNPFFACARRIARHHHENWDGSGYPDNLSRYGISVEARIVHVADVFDALTSRRPYKAAWGHVEALRAIGEMTGKAFDPEIVAALISLASRGELERAATAA
ncbi:MAG: HD domain-containing phosphohydrolase [Phycisphaerae bacterium]